MTGVAIHAVSLYCVEDYVNSEPAVKQLKQAVPWPENRRWRASSRRALFGYDKSPDLGKGTQFKPGQSGNPRGCPRKIHPLKPASPVRARCSAGTDRKTSDFVDHLNHRQLRYLEGILSGKTKKLAAIAAGYSESTARNAAAVIERPLVRLALQELVREAIPPEKIVQRLVEGLDAMELVIAKHKGKVTDERTIIGWASCLHYIELAAKMAGYYVEGQDLTLDDLSRNLETRNAAENCAPSARHDFSNRRPAHQHRTIVTDSQAMMPT